jgi:hypothetical protein
MYSFIKEKNEIQWNVREKGNYDEIILLCEEKNVLSVNDIISRNYKILSPSKKIKVDLILFLICWLWTVRLVSLLLRRIVGG